MLGQWVKQDPEWFILFLTYTVTHSTFQRLVDVTKTWQVVSWCHFFNAQILNTCLWGYIYLHVCLFLWCMCLQWWLRGPDSCSVVWWSSPSREGTGGWHPSYWPPSGSLALLYSLPTSHIPGLNHAVSPCPSPPHTTAHTTHRVLVTPNATSCTHPPPSRHAQTHSQKRAHRQAHTVQWSESIPSRYR